MFLKNELMLCIVNNKIEKKIIFDWNFDYIFWFLNKLWNVKFIEYKIYLEK